MSESALPEEVTVEQELEGLERAVGSLLDELARLRRRAESAESRSDRLEHSLQQSRAEGASPEAMEGRIRELTDENARLNAIIEEARERAGRIRSRLVVIEDEAND